MVGGGGYVGAGVQLGAGTSNGPLPRGLSTDINKYGEIDIGIAAASFSMATEGASIYDQDARPGEVTGLGVGILPKIGDGFGTYIGAGRIATATYASPTTGEMFDWVANKVGSAWSDTIGAADSVENGGEGRAPNNSKTH